jgi:hypothetical protein
VLRTQSHISESNEQVETENARLRRRCSMRSRLTIVVLVGCLSLLSAGAALAHTRTSAQRQIKATVLAYGEAYLNGNYAKVCRLIRIRSAHARAGLRADGSCIRFVELAFDTSKLMQYEMPALPHCVKHRHLVLRGRRATLRCLTGSATPSPLTLRFHLRLHAGRWRIIL